MIAVTYEQVAWHRAQKTGLATPFPSLVDAARGLLGAQAQIEAPARWALSLRTAGHPTAAEVRHALLESRALVRAWGQRDTVHVYAVEDWHLIAQAQPLWPATARTGPMPTERELADFVAIVERHGRPFTRSDLLEAAPGRLVDAFAATPVNADPPARVAITRLIWAAGRDGWLSATDTVGREQAYIARRAWVPDAPWPTLDANAASIAVARRYFAAWGPARAQDLAHYLGARVGDARRWLDALRDELAEVEVDGQPGWFLPRADRDAVCAPAPKPRAEVWPARLLPAFDTQMMSHAHKDPVVRNPADRPRIWGKAAQVAPTVIHRGVFIATWKHKAARRHVELAAEPLDGAAPHARALARALERDGAHLARHLELPEARVAG